MITLICFAVSVIYFYEAAKFSHKTLGGLKYLKSIWLITAGFPIVGILVATIIYIYMMKSIFLKLKRIEVLKKNY